MKKFSLVALGFCAIALCYKSDVMAASADADGNASVVIVNQVGIESVEDMDFGTLISPGYDGVFTLSTSGLLTCANNWVCSGSPTAGKFKISANNASVNVTYQNGVLSDGTGNTLPLTVTGDTRVTMVHGEGTLSVGATLNVPWGTSAGTYSTSNAGGSPYKVTVDY